MPPPNTQQSQQQWLSACLTLRKELRFDRREQGSETHVVIEDRVRGKFFQIGLIEYRLISEIDGEQTLQGILSRLEKTSTPSSLGEGESEVATRNPELNPDQAIHIVQWLVQNNLAYIASLDNIKRIEEQAQKARQTKLMGVINPISCKIKLFNPNLLLGRLQILASGLFSYWFLIVWLGLCFYAISILWSNQSEIGFSTLQIFSSSRWLWLLLAWVGLKAVHEMAHGLACRKFGGEVPEAGVLLILFTPLAYVNVTSMWRFTNRWHRILVSVAGIYIELFLSFVALIVWHYCPGLWGEMAFNIFIMASLNTVLFNANPLMRFDGYFILSDLSQIPNLYPKSLRWLGDRFKHYYFGTPKNRGLLKQGEHSIVPIYGVMAWCWKITISITLLICASVLFQGAGIALAALGFALWYAVPAWKQWKWFKLARQNQQINYQRTLTSTVLASSMLLGLFAVLHAPATKSAPAIVQFAGEQVIRAGSSGFAKEILVQDGQQVQDGQLLMVLSNPELEHDVFELKQRILQTTIQIRIKNLSQELAMAQAEAEKLHSLQKQLVEKQAQLDAMCIQAPSDGMIFRRGLNHQIGRYVETGDELFSFAHSETKEVIVAVDQRDWDSINASEGISLRLMFPGHPITTSRLKRVHPRASVTPFHPSMAASFGGPLAVKPVSTDQQNNKDQQTQMELLSPRFSIELDLDEAQSESLSAGQRGYAFFETKRQSMGSYLYLAISDWFHEKLELASQTSAF